MRNWLVLLLILSLDPSFRVPAQNSDTLKIGVFVSLTGATASYGTSALNAIKLATDEANRAGGVGGKRIELVVEDDHSNTQEVPGIVTKLIKDAKVSALLAEPVSTRAMAAAPIAQANKVVMISPASVKPELTQQGDYIFRACFISSAEGEALADFVTYKLKAKKVAIILDDSNDYAVVLAGFFTESFTKRGGRVVIKQRYSDVDNDMTAQFWRSEER